MGTDRVHAKNLLAMTGDNRRMVEEQSMESILQAIRKLYAMETRAADEARTMEPARGATSSRTGAPSRRPERSR